MANTSQSRRRFLLETSQAVFEGGSLRQVLVEAQDGFIILRLKGPKPNSSIQRVEIDPQREGSVSSLIGAPAKKDAAGAVVNLTLALSVTELVALIDKLGPAQKEAFFSVGLKAALLA